VITWGSSSISSFFIGFFESFVGKTTLGTSGTKPSKALIFLKQSGLANGPLHKKSFFSNGSPIQGRSIYSMAEGIVGALIAGIIG